METYDHTETAQRERAKHAKLEAIDARLARHEKVTRITLILVVILAGLSLALLAPHLIDLSN
jgi:hypothetical protein